MTHSIPLAISEPPDDDELVRRAQGGDREAFGLLHDRFAPMVHAVLLSRVPPAVAEDLTQEVFIVALQKLGSLRDTGAVGGWLARIARNRATDHHRARRPHEPLPEDLGAPPRPTAEALEVLRILQQLPEAYRETLLMRLVEGMTGPEIAARTGMTHGSVRVNLHRGMAILRDRLGGTP